MTSWASVQPERVDCYHIRGDSASMVFAHSLGAGSNVAEARLVVRNRPGGAVIFSLSQTDHGGQWDFSTSDVGVITILPADTEDSAAGDWFYDIELTHTDDTVTTFQKGRYFLLADIASGSSGYTPPNDIADLFAWYEDDQEVYQATGGAAAGIGDPVGHWGDLSGEGNHLVQGTAANKPTRQATGITFDGSNDSLYVALSGKTQPVSVFVVAEQTAAGAANDWLIDGFDFVIRMTSVYWLFVTSALAHSLTPPVGTFVIISAVVNGAASVLGVNDNEQTGNPGSRPNVASIRLASDTTNFQPCRIKAALFYSGALNNSQRQQVRDYLNAKYTVY